MAKAKAKPPVSDAEIQQRAYELYVKRGGVSRHPDEDWHEAKQQLEEERLHPATRMAKRVVHILNQPIANPFTWLEKRCIEPLANWMDGADIFRVIEKVSPVFEAVGVLLIPVVIWWGGQSYQVQRDQEAQELRQQDAVKSYLAQITTLMLDGDLRNNEDLQQLASATTLTLLRDPDLNGNRKGQVVGFLSNMQLIQVIPPSGESESKEPKPPVISLVGADLESANLFDADLRFADLSSANLRDAELLNADLQGANLNGANLYRAYLYQANLTSATLENANLSDATLERVKGLTKEQLSKAILCNTTLPPEFQALSNRDC
jgi:uncharacterized protein YjbI with pentapeptide repeats